MLKTQKISYTYNNVDITASMVFIHSWLQLILHHLPDDRDLRLKHVGGLCLWIIYNFIVYICWCV